MPGSWLSRLRGVGPLLIAGLLVLSGCTAPGVAPDQPSSECADVSRVVTATDTPKPSDIDQYSLDPWGVNSSQTFQRVECLLDTDGEQPYVSVSADRIQDVRLGGTQPQPFFAALGVDAAQTGDVTPTAFVNSESTVVITPNVSGPTAEAVLAHEFTHTMQLQHGQEWRPSFENTSLRDSYEYTSIERRVVHTALYEGSAEYVQATYRRQFVENASSSAESYRAQRRAAYLDSSGFRQYAFAPYYHGLLYFENRVEETQSLPDVFDRAPLTTEQLLHNETPATEPRTPLSVSVAGEKSFSRYGTYTNRGAVGELFTRIALSQELDRDRAIEAAAGWGNDTLATAATDDGPGFVWVTRWDSPTDADQFAAAIEDVGAERPDSIELANRTVPSEFTAERPTDDVVVVYIGSESLPRTHPVDADASNVTIRPPE